MSYDSALFGIWVNPDGSKYEMSSDGWNYALDQSVYSVSANGQVLNFPDSRPASAYTRVFGSGMSVEGVWRETKVDAGITWVEELHYRADGTFTIQWTAGGVFDSLYMGNYQVSSTEMIRKERRALVTTTNNVIVFSPPYGANYAGTYSVNSAANIWTLTLGGVDYVSSTTTFP